MSRRKRVKGGQKPQASTSASPASPTSNLYWLVPCILGFVLYLNATRFAFIYSDNGQIVTNQQIHSWDYLPRLLNTDVWSQHAGAEPVMFLYRPVFSVWLLIVFTTCGLSTWAWHISSIVLHVLGTYLLYQLGQEIFDSATAASAAALLFAVHPIHIEPVCWVSANNELLYADFVLCSLFLLCRSLKVVPERAKGWFYFSVGSYFAAVFAKESALAVFPLFFYWVFRTTDSSLNLRERLGKTIRFGAPYFVVVALYLVARLLAIGRSGLESGHHSWPEVLYTTPAALAFYLKKLILPVGLSGFYPDLVVVSPTLVTWLLTALILVGIGVLVYLSWKWPPAFGMASGLLLLPLLPVLLAMRVFLVGDLVHDRYLYLPSAGLCLFCGLAVKYFSARPQRVRMVAVSVGAVVLILFAGLTLAQEGIYANDGSYFQRGLELDPENTRIIDLLGNYYMKLGHMREALQAFYRAHELKPDDSDATFQLTVGLFNDKQYATAEPYLEELFRHSTDFAPERRQFVLFALGQTDVRLNHLARAEEVLRQLSVENDLYPGLHGTLGALYEVQGKILPAQLEYTREYEVSGDLHSRERSQFLAAALRRKTQAPSSSAPTPKSQ